MPKTLNIAVIGAGTMAQAVHLPVLRRRWDRFTVTALVDHSPRRRRESSEVWGIEEERRYETVADLLAAVRAKSVSVDAALLSTDGLHVEDLLALMRRGIPVLAEPPVGFSADEVSQVADFERMTGRRLLMMAYPQQYDDSVRLMNEQIATKDLRMIDHEVLMPASQPLFGGARVTSSAYDLPTEVRTERRKALQAAVVAGSGEGATQRDRDLYVKGLLTGVAHQLAVLEAGYGPLTRLSAVRHWPKGVIPGSIEILGELEGGARVRAVWHYLPFAPEYSERLQVLSARRWMQVELPAPSHGDQRSTISLREKKAGVVVETSHTATKGSAELMWEAFHSFVERGTEPVAGAEEARAQVILMREVLESIVTADGRSLEPEPETETEPEPELESEAEPEPESEAEAETAGAAEDVEGEGAQGEGDAVPETAAAPETVAAPETDAAPEAGTDAGADAETGASGGTEAAPDAGASGGTEEAPADIVDAWSLDTDPVAADGEGAAREPASPPAERPAQPAERPAQPAEGPARDDQDDTGRG